MCPVVRGISPGLPSRGWPPPIGPFCGGTSWCIIGPPLPPAPPPTCWAFDCRTPPLFSCTSPPPDMTPPLKPMLFVITGPPAPPAPPPTPPFGPMPLPMPSMPAPPPAPIAFTTTLLPIAWFIEDSMPGVLAPSGPIPSIAWPGIALFVCCWRWRASDTCDRLEVPPPGSSPFICDPGPGPGGLFPPLNESTHVLSPISSSRKMVLQSEHLIERGCDYFWTRKPPRRATSDENPYMEQTATVWLNVDDDDGEDANDLEDAND
uniref:Uncharacterized protein n=1 Tax=Anopheles coluzzii TaxID=1518534 RepID=A0A8W7PBT1_ANOCL